MTGLRAERVVLSRLAADSLSLVVTLRDARFLPGSLLGTGEFLYAREGSLSNGTLYLSSSPVHLGFRGNMRTGDFQGRLFRPFPPGICFSGDGIRVDREEDGSGVRLGWEEATVFLPLSRISVSGHFARDCFELMLASSALRLMDVAYLFPSLRVLEPDGAVKLSGSLRGRPSDFSLEMMLGWETLVTKGADWAGGEASLKGRGSWNSEGFSCRGRLEASDAELRLGDVRFSSHRARAIFRGRQPPDPDLDFAFEGESGIHHFFLNVGGRLSRPLTEVCSLPPLDGIALSSRLSRPNRTFSSVREDGESSLGEFLTRLTRRLAEDGGGKGSFQVSDIDLSGAGKGATVKTRWMERFSSIYGLTVRPGGADYRLGFQYDLSDDLSIINQQTFAVGEKAEEDEPEEDIPRFLLRLKGRF